MFNKNNFKIKNYIIVFWGILALNFFFLGGLSFFFFLFLIVFFLKKNRNLLTHIRFVLLEGKNFIKNNLLELKRKKYNFNYIIISLFLRIFISNYIGLLVLIPQNFLRKISLRLLIMSLSMWLFTYSTIFINKKEKISLFMIGEIKFPPLSLLLSNIEILTHLFRPITLTARLWVNIWVGHLILRAFSFVVVFLISRFKIFGFFKFYLSRSFFFIFERLIMFLQTFVFTYLIKVYFEENQHHSEMKI